MIALLFRLIWEWRPCLFTCLLFWVVAISGDFYYLSKHHALSEASWRIPCIVGGLFNALATLGNRGFMPVIGAKPGSFVSVWVKADGSHRFLFFVDRYAGCSVGDFLIFVGIGLALVIWITGKVWHA
jgi:hypothetical protein